MTRMCVSLLVTTVLLLSYFHTESSALEDDDFSIDDVTLSIEPSDEVLRGTNVTLSCQAVVDEFTEHIFQFTIFKRELESDVVVWSQNLSSLEVLQHKLTNVTLDKEGKYYCTVESGGEKRDSKPKTLKVRDVLIKNVTLSIEPTEVVRGDNVTLSCQAEVTRSGMQSVEFIIYKDMKVFCSQNLRSSDVLQCKLTNVTLDNTGEYQCVVNFEDKEKTSEVKTLAVRDVLIKNVTLSIEPTEVVRGDNVTLSCQAEVTGSGMQSVEFIIYKGRKVFCSQNLRSSDVLQCKLTNVTLDNTGEYQCVVNFEDKEKTSEVKTLAVRDVLIKNVTLSIEPTEVVRGGNVTLSCQAEVTRSGMQSVEFIIYKDMKVFCSQNLRSSDVLQCKLTNVTLDNTGEYQCVVNFEDKEKTSEVKTLAVRDVLIKNVTLSIEPTEVVRGDNVTLSCQAEVTGSGMQSVEFIIYKGRKVFCSQNLRSSDVLQCKLTNVTLDNTGEYQCVVNFEKKKKTSEVKTLAVRAPGAPVLLVNPVEVTEGDRIILTCTAPEQPEEFYLYKDSQILSGRTADSNQSVFKQSTTSSGTYKYHCRYAVRINKDTYYSRNSNTVDVSVKELLARPVLNITGPDKIFEGDQLSISCSINNTLYNLTRFQLLLYQGTNVLTRGLNRVNKVNHSLVVLAEGEAEFKCGLRVRHVKKNVTKSISVGELFSAPSLTMSPESEVFQGDDMMLTCGSQSYASERLTSDQLVYSLEPPQNFLSSERNGVFSGKAPESELNVRCVATAKNITKYSQVSTLRPKVTVSKPEISVVGQVILGQPMKILCRSHTGSLPINYTLVEGNTTVDSTTVRLDTEEAVFTVQSTNDIGSYRCVATNNVRKPQYSERLNATVTVPVSIPKISVVGCAIFRQPVKILCRSHAGSLPITYTLVEGNRTVNATTVMLESKEAVFTVQHPANLGKYRCVATNNVSEPQFSEKLKATAIIPVSIPEISVVGQVILGQPVEILCHSHTGSLPIHYTLVEGETTVDSTTVRLDTEEAVFTVQSTNDIGSYRCVATNDVRKPQYSERLNATVTVPVSIPEISVVDQVILGQPMKILCRSHTGSLPIHYTLVEGETTVDSTTLRLDTEEAVFTVQSTNDIGSYRCVATNDVRKPQYSERLNATVTVLVASWFKALVGGVSVLVMVALMAVVLGVYCYSRKGRPQADMDVGAATDIQNENL